MVSEPAQNDIDSKIGQIALMMMVRSPRRRRRLGREVVKWKAGSRTSARVASALEIRVRDGAPDRREDSSTSSETRVRRDRAGLAGSDAAASVAVTIIMMMIRVTCKRRCPPRN